jgi:hypothetical protein
LKITNTDQQIMRNPELSKADKADNLAGKKKSELKHTLIYYYNKRIYNLSNE